MKLNIDGYGWHVPKEVTSAEIEDKYGWASGWAERYSGVRKRHWVTHLESNGELGLIACENALKNANTHFSEIDMIIFAGATYDYTLPNQASIIKSKLDTTNAHHIPCLDVDTTCLSFITALEIASEKINLNKANKILIVSAEVASNGLNPNSRETYTLFGDAAAAFIVSASGTGTILKAKLKTYSSGVEDTIILGGGNKMPFKYNEYNPKDFSFKMNGKNLLRLAKRELPKFFLDFFVDLDLSLSDIDACIPHQASKSGLIMFESMFSFKEKGITVPSTLADFGNCIAASLPLTLAHSLENGSIKKGDKCLLVGTSAGFAIGSILIEI